MFLAVSVTVCGMLSSVGITIYIGYTQKYKKSIISITGLSCIGKCTIYIYIHIYIYIYYVAMIGITLTLYFSRPGITIAMAAFYGFFTIPVIPVGNEFGCELAFPVAESSVTGIIYALAELIVCLDVRIYIYIYISLYIYIYIDIYIYLYP